MKRTYKILSINNIEKIKEKILQWCNAHNSTMVWLDSNSYPDTFGRYEAVVAFEPETILRTSGKNSFNKLRHFINQVNDWVFGYFSYDLKNDIENLKSQHKDSFQWDEMFFFRPKKIIFLKRKELIFSYLNSNKEAIEADWKAIKEYIPFLEDKIDKKAVICAKMSKEEYLEQVKKMQQHILRGDIYEANFCQEFFVKKTRINPLNTYKRLNKISRTPFSVYLKIYPNFLISASPERYLWREGNQVISQPIKGTARRSDCFYEDEKIRNNLSAIPKERSENIMIVDLVRNDMSQIAQKGSVKVDELCKVYTFKQVHQMVSTISAIVDDTKHSIDLIKATFPMGSMTGAPKISAMKIIDELEYSRRGLYSGAIGYFTPKTDFDFNVVIRSILYNDTKQYVSYSVGSAITAQSNPEAEYEECLLKAKAMKSVLEQE